LWKDLNIVNEGFVHGEKKKITMLIEDYINAKKYAPGCIVLGEIDFGVGGQWGLNRRESNLISI
jgi:hypothetical protein